MPNATALVYQHKGASAVHLTPTDLQVNKDTENSAF